MSTFFKRIIFSIMHIAHISIVYIFLKDSNLIAYEIRLKLALFTLEIHKINV